MFLSQHTDHTDLPDTIRITKELLFILRKENQTWHIGSLGIVSRCIPEKEGKEYVTVRNLSDRLLLTFQRKENKKTYIHFHKLLQLLLFHLEFSTFSCCLSILNRFSFLVKFGQLVSISNLLISRD